MDNFIRFTSEAVELIYKALPTHELIDVDTFPGWVLRGRTVIKGEQATFIELRGHRRIALFTLEQTTETKT